MLFAHDSALRKTWRDMCEAGGSIFDHQGNNLTGPGYNQLSFMRYVKTLCATDADLVQTVIDEIYYAIGEGTNMEILNETAPIKCYSNRS